MHNRKWLPNSGNLDAALHSGPFIFTKSCAPTCDVLNMKCAACLFAKASTRSSADIAPRPSPKTLKLKTNHLAPGDCVSADHYFLLFPVASRIWTRTHGIYVQ